MPYRLRIAAGALFAVLALLAVAVAPAWAAQSITLTWVRHAQSTANAGGIISSTVPGPVLTELGETQAVAIAGALTANAHDGIYVSDMIRTSLTAAPYAAATGITPVVVGGVREITAGILEGLPGSPGLLYEIFAALYTLPPAAWVLGARSLPAVFGEDGNNFDARVNGAIDTIYASGDTNPVVFSHGATIQAWTLMNVTNPVLKAPLENTGVVVVTGNPEDGWTLQSWEGEPVDPEPSLLTKLLLDLRRLVVTPQTSIYNIVQSLPYDSWFTDGTALNTVAAAIWNGLVATITAPVTFVVSVVRDIAESILPPPAATSPARTLSPAAPSRAAGAPLRAQRPDRAGGREPAKRAARATERATAGAPVAARQSDPSAQRAGRGQLRPTARTAA